MIFDEPTNHLDMSSKNILQQALQQYEGTCMIVSHDRAFLDPIVNKVLEIRPGTIKTYLGNVSYYLDKKKEEAEEEQKNIELRTSNSEQSSGTLSRKEQRRLEAERRNELNKRIRPIKNKLESVEKEIEQKEERKSEIEELMAQTDFYDDSERVKKHLLSTRLSKKS